MATLAQDAGAAQQAVWKGASASDTSPTDAAYATERA